MSLTAGRGPFGTEPAGRLDFAPDPPTGNVLLLDPVQPDGLAQERLRLG